MVSEQKQRTRTIELASVIKDIAAGPFGSNLKVSCFVDEGFPIIDGANLKGIKVTDNITKFVTEDKARSLHRSIASRGDVVVTISGNVGQISYIPSDSQYAEYLVSQRQFRVTFDTEQVYIPYLVYYFHTYEGQHKILAFANQTGVPALAQPLKNFKKITIEIPSLDDQKRIASVCEAITDKIETNNKINDNLQQQAAALFANFYGQAETEVGFTEIIQILGGGTPKTGESSYWNGNVPFFTPKDVGLPYTLTTEKTITEEGLTHCNSRLYPINTVFVTARGTVGKVGLSGVPMAMNQSCYALVGKDTHQLLVYFYTLKAVDRLKHKASGAVFDAITIRDFESEIISKLSDNDAKAFLDIAEPIYQAILSNSIENLRLAALRDSLLPKLMSGEIDVSGIQL